jgi:hypothetical protein
MVAPTVLQPESEPGPSRLREMMVVQMERLLFGLPCAHPQGDVALVAVLAAKVPGPRRRLGSAWGCDWRPVGGGLL